MARRNADKLAPGPGLDAALAEKVMGWKNVHRHDHERYLAKKADKVGRWRSTKVPSWSTNPVLAHQVEERMKEIGRWERY